MKKNLKRIINSGGIPCHRCGKETQIREHARITPKLLKQPFYYRKWYYCTNTDCRTNVIVRDEDRVWNNNEAAKEYKTIAANVHEYQEKMDFLKSI